MGAFRSALFRLYCSPAVEWPHYRRNEWQTFSHLAFAFRITSGLLVGGIIFALLKGILGRSTAGHPRRAPSHRVGPARTLDLLGGVDFRRVMVLRTNYS